MFLDFLAKVAWPIVVVALAMLFRHEGPQIVGKIRKVAFPGGSVELAGDQLAHELRSSDLLTPGQLQQAVGEALALARQDGATRARVVDRIEPILRMLLKTRQEIIEFDTGQQNLQPLQRVAGAMNDVNDLADFLFYIPIEGGPPRIGDHDPLMPDALGAKFDQIHKFGGSVLDKKISLSDDGAKDYIESVTQWIDDYTGFLSNQLEAVRIADVDQEAPTKIRD